MVGGVRKELRLEDECIALPIGTAGFPDHGPVKKIAGIELNPRLIRQNFQDAPGRRILDACDHSWSLRRCSADHPVMVIPLPIEYLIVRAAANVSANWLGTSKIECRTRDAAKLAGRDQ